MWRNKSYGVTVQQFINLLVTWQTEGYISAAVWRDVEKYACADLLPVTITTATATSSVEDVEKTQAPPTGKVILSQKCKEIFWMFHICRFHSCPSCLKVVHNVK